MTLGLEKANEIVRTIIRTIDKRAEFIAQQITEGDRPIVSGTLSLRKHSTKVSIPIESLQAAGESATRRHELRTLLKRHLDRMTFVPTIATSTKMPRPTSTTEGMFRSPSSNRRGGGKR